MSDETTGQALRAEIGYAVRTAAAHGYAKGKRGAPHEGAIDTLIAQALARVLPIVEAEVRKAAAEALREAAKVLTPVGSHCSTVCHESDQTVLGLRATQMEKEPTR